MRYEFSDVFLVWWIWKILYILRWGLKKTQLADLRKYSIEQSKSINEPLLVKVICKLEWFESEYTPLHKNKCETIYEKLFYLIFNYWTLLESSQLYQEPFISERKPLTTKLHALIERKCSEETFTKGCVAICSQ